ncbi:MAG TPA: site-specific DNA-methyltransferase [Gallicola sp.]|nr:site-specific DNA-methyltransferase [Gallicola sp.]
MDKLDMKSVDLTDENIKKIGELFPNVIVESEKGLSIDFDLLKQELSNDIVEGNKEKYQLTWPGKKESILLANTPTKNTLRPIKEKSVDFDNTENIYIEGDNLEALKILQESYLNKIKCIYIDPPYNTGNDFIYNDKFTNSSEGELIESGQIDEEGNRLITNNQSNGRYHSDWLSMMYSRLKLARNLLSEDGVIFISIDDNEQANLKKLCDEIYGERNFVAQFLWTKTSTPPALSNKTRKTVEYILVYEKIRNNNKYFGSLLDNGDVPLLNTGNPNKELLFPKGTVNITYIKDGIVLKGEYEKVQLLDDIIVKDSKNENDFRMIGQFKWIQETVNQEIINGTYFLIKSEKLSVRFQRIANDLSYKTPNNFLNLELNRENGVSTNESAVKELDELGLGGTFDFPKPTSLIKYIINTIGRFDRELTVLDFFSGSATTAHSVLDLNSKDDGIRKFIMVQLPEICNEKYKTICDFGQERIRRAAKKIKEETNADIDYGFRVYKVDSSNMKDIYYKPNEIKQEELSLFETNVKEDRTNEDLLAQVILDLGLTLDLKIEEKNIGNNKFYFIDENLLVACFDNAIDLNLLDEICKYNILKLVFKESSFINDSDKINLIEKIKKISPDTEVSVI